MMEKYARTLRDACLLFALTIFIAGVLDIFLLAFDMSLRTGLMLRMGFHPRSFAQGSTILMLASIAFGVIALDRDERHRS